jgi:hypothetical protein
VLTTEDIGRWLQSQNVGVLVKAGTPQATGAPGEAQIYMDLEEPPQPDRVILLVLTGGPPPSRERTFDHPTVQVRTRGLQNDQGDAEALAGQVDDAFLGAPEGVLVNGKRVLTINRLSGPAFLSRDGGRRTTLSANYVLEVQRSVF